MGYMCVCVVGIVPSGIMKNEFRNWTMHARWQRVDFIFYLNTHSIQFGLQRQSVYKYIDTLSIRGNQFNIE